MKALITLTMLCVLAPIGCKAQSYEQGTGNPYWPARESSWIRYHVCRIQAKWNPNSRQLHVIQRWYHGENFIQIRWNEENSAIAGNFNEWFEIADSGVGTDKVPALGNMVFWTKDSGGFIGEIGRVDKKFIVSPPEPKLPMDPQMFQQIQSARGYGLHTYHQVMDSQQGSLVTFPMVTAFYVIGHLANFGPFHDCWWTSLEEIHSGKTYAVFNYIFARNIGLIYFWYCSPWQPDANGYSYGYEFYASDWMP